MDESKKGKSLVLGPATPPCTDPKSSHLIDQFQLCLEQTSPLIHVLWSFPLWPDCASTGRASPPPWRYKMKEDTRAVWFLDRHSRELTLWMVIDCLYARHPPSLILFIPHAPLVLHLTPRSQGLSWRSWTHTYIMQDPLVEQCRSNH